MGEKREGEKRTEKWTKKEILDKLHEGALEVTFKKKDGSIRVMYCTLMPHILDYRGTGEVTPRKARAENLITVFDIEKDDWRCFYLDSVIKVKPYIMLEAVNEYITR